jgi:hypothetical protein
VAASPAIPVVPLLVEPLVTAEPAAVIPVAVVPSIVELPGEISSGHRGNRGAGAFGLAESAHAG